MIVIKNAFWLSVCRVAAEFASLALFAVISRDLGPASPTVIVELSIFLIGWGLSHTFFVPAMADEAMAAPAFIELLCRSAGSLSALALCLLGATSLPLILIGFPIAGVVLVVLSLRNAAQHGARLRSGINWADIRTIARHAAPFTACEALGQFYIRADLLLITYLLGRSSAGWYAADLKSYVCGLIPHPRRSLLVA